MSGMGLVDGLDVMEAHEPDFDRAAGVLAWLERTADDTDGWAPDGRGQARRRLVRRRSRADIN